MEYIKTRDVISPERANEGDSGIDFFIPKGLEFITKANGEKAKIKYLNFYDIRSDDFLAGYNIPSGASVLIPLGIKIKLPTGYDMTLINKSSVASTTGLIVGACLIDNGYRGELILNLINTSNKDVIVKEGEKIVQGIVRAVALMPLEQTSAFEEEKTPRGEGSFGSSGTGLNDEKAWDAL